MEKRSSHQARADSYFLTYIYKAGTTNKNYWFFFGHIFVWPKLRAATTKLFLGCFFSPIKSDGLFYPALFQVNCL